MEENDMTNNEKPRWCVIRVPREVWKKLKLEAARKERTLGQLLTEQLGRVKPIQRGGMERA